MEAGEKKSEKTELEIMEEHRVALNDFLEKRGLILEPRVIFDGDISYSGGVGKILRAEVGLRRKDK